MSIVIAIETIRIIAYSESMDKFNWDFPYNLTYFRPAMPLSLIFQWNTKFTSKNQNFYFYLKVFSTKNAH